MAPKYNRLETLIRRTRRSRFAFLYTGYLSGRKAYRAVVNRFTGKQVGWVAWMQSGRWVGTTSFELVGWAYERGTGSNDVVPTVTVTCTNDRTKQKIRAKAPTANAKTAVEQGPSAALRSIRENERLRNQRNQ